MLYDSIVEAEKLSMLANKDYELKMKEWNRLVDLKNKNANEENIINMVSYKPIIDKATEVRQQALANLDKLRKQLALTM